MQKFSHRPVTLVNRKRQEKSFFFSYYRIYVSNKTELEALGDFMSLLFEAIASTFPHRESATVSLHRPTFSRFRCSNAHPHPCLFSAKRGENKSTRTLDHDLTARDPTRTYLSFFPCFFPSSLLRSRERRRVYFCTIHESRHGDGE